MFTNKKDLAEILIRDLDNQTLITTKHSIDSLVNPASGYRSIVVPETNELKKFFQEGNYTVKVYHNNDPRHIGDYVVITPGDASFVPASGVPPMSPVPTHPCDVFVLASGRVLGLHMYGEESARVQTRESSGQITFVKELY